MVYVIPKKGRRNFEKNNQSYETVICNRLMHFYVYWNSTNNNTPEFKEY